MNIIIIMRKNILKKNPPAIKNYHMKKKKIIHARLVSTILSVNRTKFNIELENRICKQIQDLHASFWCKRVEEPLKSLKIGSHFKDTA